MDDLSGSIERITFYNPENGYSVVRLRPERLYGWPGRCSRDGLVTVTGNLPELSAGEHVRLQRALDQPPQARLAVPGGVLRADPARHRGRHPPLPGLRADQGHRAAPGRADREGVSGRRPWM